MLRRHLTPAVILFLILLAGCLARGALGGRWWLLLAAAAPLAATARVLTPLASETLRKAGLVTGICCAGLVCGAALLAAMEDRTRAAYLPVPPAQVTSFTGSLVADSTLTAKGFTALRVRLSRATAAAHGMQGAARGEALLLVSGSHLFTLGQVISVTSPLGAVREPGEQAWISYPLRGEIHVQGFTSRVWELRAQARGWMHGAFERAGYPASALMEALILGSREEIPSDLQDGFKRTGSLHILALSGLHVTIIWGLLWGLFSFVRRTGARTAVACLLLVLYQVIAGFMPSLLRATVMVLVASVSLPLDRDREPLNLLALSGILLLLMDPFQAFSLSFQLSFAAMAGILLIAPVIQGPVSRFLPPFLSAPIAMSIAAQVATFPLIVSQFGVWYPSGIVAGLLLVPLTTALLWGGLAWLVLVLIPVPGLHAVCVRLFGVVYAATEGVAGWSSRLPGLTVSAATAAAVVAASALVAAAICLWVPIPAIRPRKRSRARSLDPACQP
ncbi:MAG TPA: ComEC/Rec2 family competence protein [Spirochaetia bacterium]|nr:ComEC/Rec2 family competence protein [Spirochaetia bacterium]